MGTPVLLCAAALIAAAVAAPLVQLVLRVAAGDAATITAVILRPRTLDLLLTTVTLTAAVAGGALVLGVATAWVLSAVALPLRALWRISACLPLAVPSFVAAFAWTSAIPGLSGPVPLAIVLVLATAPYVTVPTMAAFARVDHAVMDAARSLGHSPVRAFLSTMLPQVMPAALAGTLLVALYTLSDFGAPALLRVDTLTTGIYAQFTGGLDRSLSAAMALVLAALALLCVAAEALARRRASRGRPTASAPRAPMRPGRRIGALLMLGLGAVAAASVLLPPAALLVRVPSAGRYAADASELAGAALSTVGVGAAAAVLTVAASLPIAWLAARHRTRVVAVVESVTYLGHAIPGLVVALALVALTLAIAPGAYQGLAALLAAYVILFLPKAVGSSRAAIAAVSPALDDAARTLGDGPWRLWWRLSLPAAAPGVLAGGVLVMVSAMKELPATLMLRPIGFDTLATELWGMTSLGAYGAAALPALLLIAVGIVPAAAMARSLETRKVPR